MEIAIVLILAAAGVLFAAKPARSSIERTFSSFLSGASAPSNQDQESVFQEPQPAEFDEADLYALARTMWGEARGEGRQGMHAVANVIMNRYEQGIRSNGKGRQFGRTVKEVAYKPWQFSVWNANDPNNALAGSVTESDPHFRSSLEIARKALARTLPDITNGADHYHTRAVAPNWSRGVSPVAVHGSHKFFDLA